MFLYTIQLAAFVAQAGAATSPVIKLRMDDPCPDTVPTLGLVVKGTLSGGSSPTATLSVQTSHNGTDWFEIGSVAFGGSNPLSNGATLDVRCFSRVRVALSQTGGGTFDGMVVLGTHVPLKVG